MTLRLQMCVDVVSQWLGRSDGLSYSRGGKEGILLAIEADGKIDKSRLWLWLWLWGS